MLYVIVAMFPELDNKPKLVRCLIRDEGSHLNLIKDRRHQHVDLKMTCIDSPRYWTAFTSPELAREYYQMNPHVRSDIPIRFVEEERGVTECTVWNELVDPL